MDHVQGKAMNLDCENVLLSLMSGAVLCPSVYRQPPDYILSTIDRQRTYPLLTYFVLPRGERDGRTQIVLDDCLTTLLIG